MLIEKAAKFGDFFSGTTVRGQGMHHELAGGTFKDALEGVFYQLAFGFLRGETRFIDVGALVFVSANQAFASHDLHELENGGIT
jgi:hypothetical protein